MSQIIARSKHVKTVIFFLQNANSNTLYPTFYLIKLVGNKNPLPAPYILLIGGQPKPVTPPTSILSYKQSL
ncbi:MAG: hypothetical protein DRR00_21460 [Candidatus Parabeggiatoa sp. nov. 3]|nr:MAG: hypothetical protein DRR00_21460 [Gammaproteobacteria bacterium]